MGTNKLREETLIKIWNIRDYGAVFSDELQTEKIQKAIDDCFLAGGGRVVVPCGVYMTGSIRIRSNVELYLEAGAILRGSRNPEDYYGYLNDKLEPVKYEEVGNTEKTRASCIATSRWSNGLIRAFDAHDIAVVGEPGSYFDGQNCYDPQGEEHFRGPHGMSIWRCENIRLEGYTFINSSNWCQAFFSCRNITVRNVKNFGGFDGVDMRTCDNVLIEDCEFYLGDDCIAGFDNNDVTVRNCRLDTAATSIRFGGNNVLVENCVSSERRFGTRSNGFTDEQKILGELRCEKSRHESVSAFTYYCDHRADPRKPAENMIIRNCRFMQEQELIRVEFDGLHRWCCNRPMKSVRFENCEFGDIYKPGMIFSREDEKSTVEFIGCKIHGRPGTEAPLFSAGTFEKILFEDCVIDGFKEPIVLVFTDDPVETVRSTPIRVIKTTREECVNAHPTGRFGSDVKAGRRFD